MKRSSTYFAGYAAVSTALFLWAVYDSLDMATEYFTFAMELTEGYKLGILINLIFFVFMAVGKFLLYVCFDELRDIEVEHIMERLPLFVINLLFNLTNNENLMLSCFLIGVSVVSKVFHIVLQDRFDLVHMRITNGANLNRSSSKSVLVSYLSNLYFWFLPIYVIGDFGFAKFLVYDVFKGLNSITCLLFGFPFAIQGLELVSYWCKALLNVYEAVVFRPDSVASSAAAAAGVGHDEEVDVEHDLEEEVDLDDISEIEEGNEVENEVENEVDHNDDEDDEDEDEDDDDLLVWDNKGYYHKAIDIVTSSFKSIAFLSFIYLLTIASNLTLPLSMIQGTYSSVTQTFQEIKQLLAFIESSKKLTSVLPNATDEDLAELDTLCIICREDMHSIEHYESSQKKISVRKHPKKLHCGHIIHMGCLKDWLERSEVCPLCRGKVFMLELDIAIENELRREQEIQADRFNRLADLAAPVDPEAPIPDSTSPNGNTADSGVNSDTRSTPDSGIPITSLEDSISGSPNELGNECQVISLPTNIQIPPGWTILPIEKDGPDYNVSISKTSKASLRLRRNSNNENELNLLRGVPFQPNDGQ